MTTKLSERFAVAVGLKWLGSVAEEVDAPVVDPVIGETLGLAEDEEMWLLAADTVLLRDEIIIEDASVVVDAEVSLDPVVGVDAVVRVVKVVVEVGVGSGAILPSAPVLVVVVGVVTGVAVLFPGLEESTLPDLISGTDSIRILFSGFDV